MISVSACATLPSDIAICGSTQSIRKAHAVALLDDAGPRSQATGERVLTAIKAGCNE